MIAGALGPVASAFSICALARPWRQYLPPGADIQGDDYPNADPSWFVILNWPIRNIQAHNSMLARLIAVNAVQLVMALVSNAFLLLNMARRVRFTIAQPITITGW